MSHKAAEERRNATAATQEKGMGELVRFRIRLKRSATDGFILAKALTAEGAQVTSSSARGVSAQATREDVERIFMTELKGGKDGEALAFKNAPLMPRTFRDAGAISIYFPHRVERLP